MSLLVIEKINTALIISKPLNVSLRDRWHIFFLNISVDKLELLGLFYQHK